jgi:hypothetical protein
VTCNIRGKQEIPEEIPDPAERSQLLIEGY